MKSQVTVATLGALAIATSTLSSCTSSPDDPPSRLTRDEAAPGRTVVKAVPDPGPGEQAVAKPRAVVPASSAVPTSSVAPVPTSTAAPMISADPCCTRMEGPVRISQGPIPKMQVFTEADGHELPFTRPLDWVAWHPADHDKHMLPGDSIVGVVVNGKAHAIPWWKLKNHHVANLTVGGQQLLVLL